LKPDTAALVVGHENALVIHAARSIDGRKVIGQAAVGSGAGQAMFAIGDVAGSLVANPMGARERWGAVRLERAARTDVRQLAMTIARCLALASRHALRRTLSIRRGTREKAQLGRVRRAGAAALTDRAVVGATTISDATENTVRRHDRTLTGIGRGLNQPAMARVTGDRIGVAERGAVWPRNAGIDIRSAAGTTRQRAAAPDEPSCEPTNETPGRHGFPQTELYQGAVRWR
jgi:hypothetical protein